jgi:hypothetical protein
MSAPTGIGEDRSYFFASEGLELDIAADKITETPASELECLVNIDDDYVQLTVTSTSIDTRDRKVLCLKTPNLSRRMLRAFTNDERLGVVLVGLEFKALVSGVESDRSYLTILEQENAGV